MNADSLRRRTIRFSAACPLAPLIAVGIAWVLSVSVAIAEEETDPQPAPTEVATEEPAGTPASTGTDSNAFDQAEDEEQPPTTPGEDIEEITVTGKSTEGMVSEPVSTVAFTPSQLEREQIIDIADLANYTPNLSIKTAFAASNPTIFIRGVGLDDFNANAAGAVAVYQDGIYLNSPAGQLFQIFDTAGVEVLRGPQSGQFRNASAGAILVRSRMPTDELEGYGRFSYGNYDAIDIEGAASGPIPSLEDYLSGRVAFRVRQRDGVTENRCGDQPLAPRQAKSPACLELDPNVPNNLGDPRLRARDVNDIDQWAIRGLLQFVAPIGDSETEWLINAHGGQNRSLSTQFQNRGFIIRAGDPDPVTGEPTRIKLPGRDASNYRDVDGDPFAGDYNITGPEDLDLWGVSLRGEWIGESYEITSISGYEWHDRFVLEQTDANPRNMLVIKYTDDSWQFSQELQLHKTWSDELESTVGVFFLMEDLDVFNAFNTPGSLLNFDQGYTQKTRTGSVFGTGTWDFLTDFTLDAAFRYSWEYKQLDLSSNAFGPDGGSLETVGGVEDDVFDGASGSVSLEYSFMETNSAHLKYTRGWKPGHFNGGAIFSGEIISPVDPESVDSFEGGFRTNWFDGRLEFDAAAFFYKFKNMQIFQLQQETGGFPVFQLINAQTAEILGVEASVRAEPIEGLEIQYEVGWLDSEYPEFISTITRLIPKPPGQPRETFTDAIDYTGNRLLGSPDWSMSGSVEYSIPLPPGLGALVPRFSFTFQDDIFFDPAEGKGALQDLPADTIAQKAFWLFNAGLLWRNDDEWLEVSGWVRNITDKAYRVQSFDVTEDFRFVADIYGDPRTYGFTVSVYY